MQKRTLLQIRNLINRRNVSKHPKVDVNAAKDFLEVIVTEHVLSAAMTYLGISTLDECHQISHFPDDRKRIH